MTKSGTNVFCSVRLTGYIDKARSLLRKVPSFNYQKSNKRQFQAEGLTASCPRRILSA